MEEDDETTNALEPTVTLPSAAVVSSAYPEMPPGSGDVAGDGSSGDTVEGKRENPAAAFEVDDVADGSGGSSKDRVEGKREGPFDDVAGRLGGSIGGEREGPADGDDVADTVGGSVDDAVDMLAGSVEGERKSPADGDDVADRLSGSVEGEREGHGDDVAGAGGEELGFSGIGKSEHVDTECVDTDLGESSGLILRRNDDVEVGVKEFLVVDSVEKHGKEDGSMPVVSELQPLDEEMAVDEMDGKDELSIEKVLDFVEEIKTEEETETEKLIVEMGGETNELGGGSLVNNDAILGEDDVAMGEGESLGVGSDVVERDNSSTGAEMVTETSLNEEKDNEKKVVVDTEMDTEEEVREGDEDEAMGEEDEENLVETEDTDIAEVAEEEKGGNEGGGKRKRGKKSRAPSKAPAKKVIEEDVCFICFDGGDLVLCDRRGCPKAYHASCVNRDEAFFQAKGRWNCGWHQCSTCATKNGHFMCYTCPFSVCKACSRDSAIYCVRGNKGLCESCMETVSLIENPEKEVNEDQDFNDNSSWLYLFKDYWLSVKQKLSLSATEISQAKNPYKGADKPAGKRELAEEAVDVSNRQGSCSDREENLEANKNKRKKTKKRLKSRKEEKIVDGSNNQDSSSDSEENLEANKSKRKKTKKRLKTRKEEEIVDGSNNQDSSSDSEENLEAKIKKRAKTPKKLKSRKEDTSPATKEDLPPARKLKRNATFGTEVTFKPIITEWASKELLEFVMHMKNGDKAAISQFDVQALLLEYIKTNKLRDPRRKSQIICDVRLQSLFCKPRVGHFEMLKLLESHFLIKENSQTDDNQGTVVDEDSNEVDADIDTTPRGGKDKRRKGRKKGQNRGRQSNLDDYAAIDMHNIGLIFLRRKLVEDLLEDVESFCDKAVGTFVRIRISANTQKQDMYRLVKVLGTSKGEEPYKVGKRTTDLMLEILNLNKKELVSIDTISNQDFTEEECTRLRQSIKCGLISRLTVGDILDKATEIQAARVSDWLESEVVRISHLRDRASDLGRRKELRECVEKLQLLKTPEERRRRLDEIPEIHADPNMDPGHESEEHDSAEEDSKQESFVKTRGSAFSRRGGREPTSPRGGDFSVVDSWIGSRQNSGKNFEVTRNISTTGFSNKSNESATGGTPIEGAHRYGDTQHAHMEKAMSPINSVNVGQSSISFARSESFSSAATEVLQPSLPAVGSENATSINESEKMWNYKDPAGKAQGPFSIVQLRKWSKNGYFPADLRIWKTKETEDVSILLTDALDGTFHKQLVVTKTNTSPTQLMDQNLGSQSQMGTNWGSLSVEVSKSLGDKSNDSFNPPSPTPNTSTPISLIVQTENFAPANQNGIQENTSPASILNSARQIMSNLENGTTNPLSNVPPMGTNIAQQTPMTNETQVWGTQQMVTPYQTAPNGAPTQNVDPNSSYSMPIQHTGQNPWVGAVPTTVQNPSGTFPMPGYAAMPPQSVPGQQPTYPVQMAPNVPWGMGMVQGNPNMGWGVGMVQSNPNMNWAPMVNPGWIAPNPGTMVNQGWVAQPVGNQSGGGSVAQGTPYGNVNPGWGPPNGTTNTPPTGNASQSRVAGMPPGKMNSEKGNSGNWSTPPGNSGGRRNNEGYRSGGSRFSGPRDRERGGGNDGRQFRPKAHCDSHGNRICPYFLEGHCRKGSRCDMVHQNLPDNKM